MSKLAVKVNSKLADVLAAEGTNHIEPSVKVFRRLRVKEVLFVVGEGSGLVPGTTDTG